MLDTSKRRITLLLIFLVILRKQGNLQFVVFEIFKCLFIPKFTSLIMSLLVNNTLENILFNVVHIVCF